MLTAFFLEAGFLGVMVFGVGKVGKGLHFLATCMVALGTVISATWIVAVNSWMQTPAGFALNAKGQFVPAGLWLAVIFNPSFPYRLVRTVIGAYLTTAFVVGAVGAFHLLKDRANPGAYKMFSMAMWMAALVTPVQIAAGDAHGLNTLEHQPTKVLAMEGDYAPSSYGAPFVGLGLPESNAARVRYAVAIPGAGSPILKRSSSAPLQGLKDYPRDLWPPVAVVFWSFRIMVGLGLAMLALGLWSLIARARRWLYDWRWLHRAALIMGPSGFIAVLAGWMTTEVGRQPYTVYGQLLTAQSHSPLAAPAVEASLQAFVVVYFFVFGTGALYLLRLMSKPPEAHEPDLAVIPARAAGATPVPSLGVAIPAAE